MYVGYLGGIVGWFHLLGLSEKVSFLVSEDFLFIVVLFFGYNKFLDDFLLLGDFFLVFRDLINDFV